MAKLEQKTLAWIWTISGLLAGLSILPLTNVCSNEGPCGVFLMVGLIGLTLSAIVSNIHDPNLALAVFFNWILFASVAIAIAKFRRSRRGESAS